MSKPTIDFSSHMFVTNLYLLRYITLMTQYKMLEAGSETDVTQSTLK